MGHWLLLSLPEVSQVTLGSWLILIAMGLLLFSLLATQLFFQLRKPLLGFALGALPIFLLWLALSLWTEWSLYECRRGMIRYCELTGLEIGISTLIAVAILTLSVLTMVGLDLAHLSLRQNGTIKASHRGGSARPFWSSLLIILASGGLGTILGYAVTLVVGWLTVLWLAPMLGFASAIIFMVYEERKPAV